MRVRLLLVAGLLAASPAFASGPPLPSVPASAAILRAWRPRAWHPPTPARVAGLRVAIDPATGELTMPIAGDPSFAGAPGVADRSAFVVETRADGSRRMLLNGGIRAYTIARLGAGGGLFLDCAHSESDARVRLAAPAPAPAAEDR